MKLLHEDCAINNAIIITPDSWVVEVATSRILSKLPFVVSIEHFITSQTSIAFVTADRQSNIFIMHFPPVPTPLTTLGMWDVIITMTRFPEVTNKMRAIGIMAHKDQDRNNENVIGE
jgi:hypothetical protein